MQPKARMTFRFDPPRPSPRPQPPLGAPQPGVHQDTSPPPESVMTVDGPLQDDPNTLEDLIRRSSPVKLPEPVRLNVRPEPEPVPDPARGLEAEEWIPETAQPVLEILHPGHTAFREGPSWWRVFASVAGAIATGALFGYLVLTLFTGDSPFPGGTARGTDKPAQAAAGPDKAEVPSQTAAVSAPGTEAASGTNVREAIPAETFYLLQYGVFRSEESMNAAMETLKERGLPGTADRTDGFRVYIGAGGTKEEAERLAGQISGMEVFVKTSALEAVTVKTSSGEPDISAFLSHGEELMRGLSLLSIDALEDEMPQPLDPARLDALKQSHRLLLQSGSGAVGLPGPAKEAAETMLKELNEAIKSLDDYERGISRFHLWSVQSDVTEAIVADRLLRASLV